MNVLYISYDGMTDPLGQSQVLPYLKGLSKNGYAISLISFEKNQWTRYPEVRQLIEEADIDWSPLLYTKKPPVLSTIFDIQRMKRKAAQLQRRKKFNLVHCRSYIASLVGIYLKRKYGIKFIFDMRGFWADERIDGDIWNYRNPLYRSIYRFFKRKERQFLQQSDYTISLTYNGKDVIEKFPYPTSPVEVIPCCVDLDLFSVPSYEQTQSIKEKLGINADDLVLGYLGSIGTWYMLTEMLLFFKRLQMEREKARFLFITGDDPNRISNEAAALGIRSDLIQITKAARHEVPLYLSACDITIFFIKPVFSKRASSPTKQGEIMSMGIPIICNKDVGDTDFVVKKYKSGFLIDNFTDAGYANATNIIDQILALDKEKIKEGARAFYSLSQGINRYLKVYQAVSQ